MRTRTRMSVRRITRRVRKTWARGRIGNRRSTRKSKQKMIRKRTRRSRRGTMTLNEKEPQVATFFFFIFHLSFKPLYVYSLHLIFPPQYSLFSCSYSPPLLDLATFPFDYILIILLMSCYSPHVATLNHFFFGGLATKCGYFYSTSVLTFALPSDVANQ